MSLFLSEQAALDALESLREYISKHKTDQKEITLFNKILHCAVNEDDIDPMTHRWENFWLFLDVEQFPIFDSKTNAHIVEDAIDFVQTELQNDFAPGTEFTVMLMKLFRKTRDHLEMYSPKCYIFFQMDKFISFVNSDAQKRQQVQRILFSLHCYENEDQTIQGIHLLQFLFKALSSPSWWKDNMTPDLVTQEFIDYWDYLKGDEGAEIMFKMAVDDAIQSILELKKKVTSDLCAQKLIEYSFNEEKGITPTP